MFVKINKLLPNNCLLKFNHFLITDETLSLSTQGVEKATARIGLLSITSLKVEQTQVTKGALTCQMITFCILWVFFKVYKTLLISNVF